MTGVQIFVLAAFALIVVLWPLVLRGFLVASRTARDQMADAAAVLLANPAVPAPLRERITSVMADPVSPWLITTLMRDCLPARVDRSVPGLLLTLPPTPALQEAGELFWHGMVLTAVASSPLGALLLVGELLALRSLSGYRLQARAWLASMRAALAMAHLPHHA